MYTCKIRSRSDESRPSYCTILISKITAVRHLGDLKICSFREKFHLMPNSRDLKNYGTAYSICSQCKINVYPVTVAPPISWLVILT